MFHVCFCFYWCWSQKPTFRVWSKFNQLVRFVVLVAAVLVLVACSCSCCCCCWHCHCHYCHPCCCCCCCEDPQPLFILMQCSENGRIAVVKITSVDKKAYPLMTWYHDLKICIPTKMVLHFLSNLNLSKTLVITLWFGKRFAHHRGLQFMLASNNCFKQAGAELCQAQIDQLMIKCS